MYRASASSTGLLAPVRLLVFILLMLLWFLHLKYGSIFALLAVLLINFSMALDYMNAIFL